MVPPMPLGAFVKEEGVPSNSTVKEEGVVPPKPPDASVKVEIATPRRRRKRRSARKVGQDE